MQWLTLVLNYLKESWTQMWLIRRSNSVVSGLQRISRTCSLRALNSRTNVVRRSNSMNGLQLNYISRTCSLRAFSFPSRNWRWRRRHFDGASEFRLVLSLEIWIPKSAILRLIPNIGLSHGCKMTSEPCHTEKGRRRSANICVVRLR
jgi:hypothetical protein